MNFNAVAQYMDDVMRGKHSVACCDIIVRHEHEQLYRYMCGNCDHEGKVPVSEKTLYYFYSCTKPVTVAAGMRLVEEGKLRLDAPVSDYLPEFAEVFLEKDGKRVPPKKAITVWNLFTMSAGLDYNYYNNEELKCAVEASGLLPFVRCALSRAKHFSIPFVTMCLPP